MIIVSITDFVGIKALPKSTALNPVLQDFIDKFEKSAIIRLLGIDLGNAFLTEIQAHNPPTTPRFQTIFNPFFEKDNLKIRESKGIKELLVAQIYYHVILESQTVTSQSGVIGAQSENANVLTPVAAVRKGEVEWNRLMDTWENIQWYIRQHSDTYPEYDSSPGEEISAQFSAIL